MATRKTTRGAQGNGSIRQRPDGRWEARYTVGRSPGTGKQDQKSVYGDTQAEVRKKLNAIIKDIDDGVYKSVGKIKLGEWLDIWLAEYVKDSVKPFTYTSYEVQCRTHIKPALGAVKLSALSTHAIQAFYNKLYRGDGDTKPLSAKTIKNTHGVLHKALKQAVMLGYIKYNPSEACNLPRIVKKEIKPLEEADISAFLEAVQGHRYETVYVVTLFTGMRQGEVLGLSWDNVDFKTGSIFINKQLQREKTKGGKYYLATLKNDKGRHITPARSVMELLKDQRQAQLEMRFKAGKLWNNEHNLVFTNELGGNLSHVTVYNNFKRIVTGLGMPEARFHDLRHSYAVAALSSGDNVKTVQENLGHHTAAFTLDVYGHTTEKMKKESAERMEGFIQGVKNL